MSSLASLKLLPAVMVVLLLVLYLPAAGWLVSFWWTHLDSFIGIVAVPISAFLGYNCWVSAGKHRRLNLHLGWLWLALAAISFCLVGYATANMLLSCLSAPFLIYALLAAVWGGRYAKKFSFPIVFLFFAMPIFDLLEIYLSFPMRLGSTALASFILMPFMPVSFAGTQLMTPALEVAVIESCSGLSYLTTLLMLGVLLSWLTLSKGRDRFLLMIAVPVIVLIANSMRIAVIGVIGALFGRDVAIGFFHDFSGMLLFALAVAGMIGVAWAIERCSSSLRRG